MYWSPRAKDGSFAEPRRLLHDDGTELMAGMYWDDDANVWTGTDASGDAKAHGNSIGLVDFDDDGLVDLLIGCSDGRIFLRRGVASEDGPRFTLRNEKIRYGRRSLFVEEGGATPVAADWDGDGLFDIVSGSKTGGVFVWLNVGERGAPSFSAPQRLVEDAPDPADPKRPHHRVQVCVSDYDGDGRADLLVGDYRFVDGKRPGHVWLYLRRSERGDLTSGGDRR